ncbi:nuclease-related domain-containing protein [Sporolactobacillus kofuensis]|uniref:Nuclease-related domain-containing protein n=1 Tax=Sporolactobacillus kofuensis TaxID=269672 RepID=A0ABW1WFZ4_9BACL|nr:NERD domain-containing protein [Sporolactobacillus kofuensis]
MNQQFIPMRLLTVSALLRHLPEEHPKFSIVESDFIKRQAGWRGEQKLSYYLDALPQQFHCLYNLRLSAHIQTPFEIDALIISPFALYIVESKNYFGTIYFDSVFNQFIRLKGEHQEGFPNPLVQATRHKDRLAAWLSFRHLVCPPIQCLISIANTETLIKASSKDNEIGRMVCHAEQLVAKIIKNAQSYTQQLLDATQLYKLEKLLLSDHTEPETDVLAQYSISAADLLYGVQCSRCRCFTMKRIARSWKCNRCGHADPAAANQMMLDYFLLFGKTMTNSQCRNFLKVPSRHVVARIRKQMGLEIGGSGCGIGLHYLMPNHQYFHQNYQLWRKQ